MSKRTRLKEIMTRAGLIDDELALERAKAQRGAQTTHATLHALSSLIDTGANVVPRAYDVAADHMAQDAMAPHATTTPEGDAATEAARAVEGAEGLQPSAAQDPISFVINAVSAPAREAAKQRATAGLTERFAANQDRSRELERQRVEDQRRTTEFNQGQQDRRLRRLVPTLEARADEAHEPDAAGAWVFDGSLEGDGGVQMLDARGAAVDDMADMLEGDPDAALLAQGFMAEGDARQAAAREAQRRAELDAEDRELKRKDIEAGIERKKAAAAKDRRPPRPRDPNGPLPPHMRAPPKLAERVLALNEIEESLSNIRQMKGADPKNPTIDTGPVQAILAEIGDVFGTTPVDVAAFRAATGEQFARYVKSLSGAAASDKEVQRLLKNLPTIRDSDAAFLAKLDIMQAVIDAQRRSAVRSYQEAGFPVGRFGRYLEPRAQVTTQAAPSGGGDYVTVRLPGQTPKRIPAGNLAAAQAKYPSLEVLQ